VKRNWLILIMGAVFLLSLVGCGTSDTSGGEKGSEEASKTTLEKAQETGKIVVGFANEKPYAYKDADGTITGEAVEVARAVLSEMGIKEMEGVVTEFSSLIPGLKAGRFDVITAGMYITPERCKEVAFGEPEYSIGESLAVAKGNPLNLKSYQDIIDNPDAKIAIMAGAIESTYLSEMGMKPEQIVTVPDIPSNIQALESGRVDAITMTSMTLRSALEGAGTKNIEVVADFEQPVINGKDVRGYGAAAFKNADTDFVEAYNAELQKMKSSGKLLEIISEFGFTESELPGDVTKDQLCGA
jgi:polar amino acid transport system substrate-binding protein